MLILGMRSEGAASRIGENGRFDMDGGGELLNRGRWFNGLTRVVNKVIGSGIVA